MHLPRSIARLGFAATLSLAALAPTPARAADEPTRAVEAGELTFKVPEGWKAEKPRSQMRKAQFKVAPVEGDTEPAELVLFEFPNGAGTVEANIARWEGQFTSPTGGTPKAKVEKVKGTNVDATRIEVGGRYIAAMTPGAAAKNDKPDFRLLGVIVETQTSGYYFKMVGPEKTMVAARPGFDAMIASMTKK